ncbi:putative AP-1 complex subunit gamma protein, partial [Naja naja]
VLHTSVVLLTEMCERSPDMLAHFRKVRPYTPTISGTPLRLFKYLQLVPFYEQMALSDITESD